MTRKKVKLAYITNDAARKATFKKRKKGLMKKVNELSTLCGIKACAIIYNPYDREPEVWPSPFGVQSTISTFRKKSEIDQNKNMVNQDSFLRQRITKVEEQVKKQRRENREKEMERVMYQSLVGDQGLQKLNLVDLNELGWMVDRNIKETVEKMKQLGAFGPKSAMTTVSNVYQEAVHHMTSNNRDQTQDDHEATKNMEMQNQQWIMDMLQSNDHNIMGFGRNVDQEVTHPPTTAFNINGNMWCNFSFP